MAKKKISGRLALKLAGSFLVYQAKKQLGDSVFSELLGVLGEDFEETISSQLDWNQEKIKLAFEEADRQFLQSTRSNVLRQAIISQPLAGIENLEKFAQSLPETLDDNGLELILKDRFQTDWPNLSKKQIENAAKLYHRCLDNALASKAGQLQETTFRILNRVDQKVDKLLEIQKESKKNKKASYTKYLKDITKKLSLWQKKYTPLFANFEQLTLFAQVTSTTDDPKPLLQLIQNKPKLVVLGVAGSGKTTTLNKIALEHAKNALTKSRNSFIPILIQLRNYHGSLEELFRNQLAPWGIDMDSFQDDLVEGKFLLIFDGVNEIPNNKKSEGLAELRQILAYDKNRFLFTSRTVDYEDSQLALDNQTNLPVCEILPLTKEQVKDCARRYLGSKNANLIIAQLKIDDDKIWESERSLAQLVRVPLWLQMIILVFERLKRIPRNEGDLLLQFIDEILLRREPSKSASKYSPDIKKEVLSAIAFQMYSRGLVGDAPKRFAYTAFSKRLSELLDPYDVRQGEELWHEIQSNHLLIEQDETISWPHPLFQELFVGLSLRNICFDDLWRPNLFEIEVNFDFMRAKKLGDSNYDAGVTMLEVVPEKYRPEALVAVGLYNPSLVYEAYLRMEPEYNLTLSSEFLERGLEYLRATHKGKEHRNLVKTVRKVGGKDVCPILADISASCVTWEGREQALYELYFHENRTVVDLVKLLTDRAILDESDNVRLSSLSFLLRMKKYWNNTIPFLIDRLLQEPFDFEMNCRKLITAEISKENSFLQALIFQTQNSSLESQQRMRAMWIIGEFLPGNKTAENVLINIGRDEKEDIEIRRISINSLKGLRNYLKRCSEPICETKARRKRVEEAPDNF